MLAKLLTIAVFATTPLHTSMHKVHPPKRRKNPIHKKLKLPKDYQVWSKVAQCESGGWEVLGYAYPDSLGIDRANYEDFGGVPQPMGAVSLENRIVQIQVADRLIASYGMNIPDQYGCSGAW